MMQMLRQIADETKPTSHPRADDLLGIGADMARTLEAIQRDLDLLDREYRRGHGMDTEGARDAFYRLLAQRGWVEALTGQYHQVRADLDGEGYALLGKDGTGVPYFDDDDGGNNNDEDEVDLQ